MVRNEEERQGNKKEKLTESLHLTAKIARRSNYNIDLRTLQYVAQYPDGTSIRTLETKTQFLRRPFQFSVNEVFRMKAEHFSFKMKVLAI